MKKLFVIAVVLYAAFELSAQVKKNNLVLPEIEGYSLMKCDFHMHTVFSDGMVWPVTRVNEAFQEGLDAIALTDHIEYRPKVADFTTKDHLRSYEVAKSTANDLGIILIKGTEITRKMPPGHLNAIFISDANVFESFVNKSDTRDGFNIAETLAEGKKQNGFVFWNHPWFQHPENRSEWQPIHEELYKKGLFQGIEVVNGDRYDPIILQWCLDKNLTVISNSDIHTPMVLQQGEYRSMTLIFAKEKSEKGIHDALISRRTVAYSSGFLYGSKEWVKPIIEGSLTIAVQAVNNKKVLLSIKNTSGIKYDMEVADLNGLTLSLQPYPKVFSLDARSETIFQVGSTGFEKGKQYEFLVNVKNAQIGANKPLPLSIKFKF